MYRDYIIFSTTGNGNGYAKIESADLGFKVAVAIRGYGTLKNDEVFKAFFVQKNNPSIHYLLGSLDNGKGVFNLPSSINYDAVIITRKNVNTGSQAIEFWGFHKGAEFDIKTVTFADSITQLEQDKIKIAQTATKIADDKIEQDIAMPHFFENQKPQINNNSTQPKAEKFKISPILNSYGGGGFTWQRVNGYFSMFSYSIMQHILSSQIVYSCIMSKGYYILGVREDMDCLYIAIVLPVTEKDVDPFQHIGEFSSIIAQSEDTTYYAVCVGIDDAGEFFCKVE